MSVREMAGVIGTEVRLHVQGLVVYCKVVDARMSYGLRQYLVTPTAGSGSQWVDAARCKGVDRG